jgi:hypothetical protein
MEKTAQSQATAVRRGDILVEVDGKSIESMKFEDTLFLLRHIRYPVRLTFSRFINRHYLAPLASKTACGPGQWREVSLTAKNSPNLRHTLGECAFLFAGVSSRCLFAHLRQIMFI